MGQRTRTAQLFAAAWLAVVPMSVGAAPPAPVPRCPSDAEIARRLRLAGPWVTGCLARPSDGLLLAAFLPPEGKSDPPELIVASSRPDGTRQRTSVHIGVGSGEDDTLREIAEAAEQWDLRVGRTRFASEELLQVTLIAQWGGDPGSSYEVVSLLRQTTDALIPLWSGLGSWRRTRRPDCHLTSRAVFNLLPPAATGEPVTLERFTRTDRRPLTSKRCLPPPSRRDRFPLLQLQPEGERPPSRGAAL